MDIVKSEEGPYLKVDIGGVKMEGTEIDILVQLKEATDSTQKMKMMEEEIKKIHQELKEVKKKI